MHTAQVWLIQRLSLWLALATLPLLAGCVSYSQDSWKQSSLDYKPIPAPARIPASAMVEVVFSTTEGVKSSFKTVEFQTDQSIANYEQAVADVLYNDLAQSGLFTRVNRVDPQAELILQLRAEQAAGGRLRIDLTVLNPQTKETVLSHTREKSGATAPLRVSLSGAALGELMGGLKADLAADFKNQDLSRLGGKFAILQPTTGSAGGPVLAAAELTELLVAKEVNLASARQRNRALIAAKTLSLPKLLREKSTTDLKLLSVQVEQVILDLNHEAEVQKDQAQRALERAPQAVEQHRELAIVYRERIEILKPIGTAIKEEIANRNR